MIYRLGPVAAWRIGRAADYGHKGPGFESPLRQKNNTLINAGLVAQSVTHSECEGELYIEKSARRICNAF